MSSVGTGQCRQQAVTTVLYRMSWGWNWGTGTRASSLCIAVFQHGTQGTEEFKFGHGSQGSSRVMLLKIGGQNNSHLTTLKYLDTCYVSLLLLSWMNQAADPQMLRENLLIPISFQQKLGANHNK